MQLTEPACSLCGDAAVATFALSDGCVARPHDRVQRLCTHHAVRARPLGSMLLVADHTKDHAFTRWWEGGCRD